MFLTRKSSLAGFILWFVLIFTVTTSHASWWFWSDGNQIDNDEVVTFFPGSGSFDPARNLWTLNIEGWIYEPENCFIIRSAAEDAYELFAGEAITDENDFWERMKGFVVDNESRERVVIQLGTNRYTLPESSGGGRISGTITLTPDEVDRLNPDNNGWVFYTATSENNRTFEGKCRLIAPQGLSVISDIDDTIKVTEVYEGNVQVAKNTFNRPLQSLRDSTTSLPSWRMKALSSTTCREAPGSCSNF